jgi:hypothetical protein
MASEVKGCVSSLFSRLLFITNLHAQTNCPNHDDKAPAPLALVSSPLTTLHTGQSESVLNLPTRIYVDVKKTVKAYKAELWTGPTGTDVAESYCRLASDERPVEHGSSMRFALALTTCKDVGGRLEPRVFVRGCRTVRAQVSEMSVRRCTYP